MSMAAASSKAREAVKLPANGDEDDGAIPIVESNREKMKTVYNLLLPSRDRPASDPAGAVLPPPSRIGVGRPWTGDASVRICLRSIRKTVRVHGLSLEEQAGDEDKQIVDEAASDPARILELEHNKA
jgi:hypothetical protein